MDYLKKMDRHEIILIAIFVAYLLFDVQAPKSVCSGMDNLIGNIFIGIVAIYIVFTSNLIVGILAILVAYQFISRCQFKNSPLEQVSEFNKKGSKFVSPWKQMPVTLEEEMVSQLAPTIIENNGDEPSNYKPVSSDLHGSSYIH